MAGLSTLTPTEQKIYDLYLAGMGTKEVMETMQVKESTLRYHNKNLYSKLGVNSREQLVLYGLARKKQRHERSREVRIEEMRILFAPMEGFTGYTFRNVHHSFYGGIAEYYTPFLSVRQTRKWKTREKKDIDPDLNQGVPVIPQLLTNKAEDFLWAAGNLAAMGYREINLNLGCPSATVVTKHKGAGFLEDPDELDEFFEQVFAHLPPGMQISVKTRLGLRSPAEMDELLPVFNRYPFKKIIVHPRVRADYYAGSIDLDAFRKIYEDSANPVVYNGDIGSVADFCRLREAFQDLQEIMIGRGLIRHPDLAEQIVAEDSCSARPSGLPPKASAGEPEDVYVPEDSRIPESDASAADRFRRFHDALLAAYVRDQQEPNNCLPKMKDLWSFWALNFPGREREIKKIRKARTLEEYVTAVRPLLQD